MHGTPPGSPRRPWWAALFCGAALVWFVALLTSCGGDSGSTSTQAYTGSRISYLQPRHPGALRPNQLPPAASRPTAGPSVHAVAALVMDANTGRILFEKNADQRRAIASTQKLLTALVVVERGDLNRQVTIAASDGQVEPTRAGVRAGERYSRRDLTHMLLVCSGNDVARTLARDHSGSVSAFANAMNRRAAQIGMHSSRFVNPHGLTEPGQYSSARDLGTLALRCWHNPQIRSMIDDRSFTLRSSSGRAITKKTTNKLALRWPACLGMKTGYTNAAGKCLVSVAQVNGRTIICVLLGTNSAHIWDDSEELLRWGATR